MTLEQAIQKAVEGGFMSDFLKDKPNKEMLEYMRGAINNYVLAPSFWQALSKSMGREDVCWRCHQSEAEHDSKEHPYSKIYEAWKVMWSKFYHHLAEGKSIEDYFKNL